MKGFTRSLIDRKPELLDKIKKDFASQNTLNVQYPSICLYEPPEHFWFTSDNYSTLIVSNMVCLKELMNEFINWIINISESYTDIKNGVNFIQEKIEKEYGISIFSVLKNSLLIPIVCQLFHTNSLELSVRLIVDSTCGFIRTINYEKVSACLTWILSVLTSKCFIGLIGAAYGYYWALTLTKLQKERFENYSAVLKYIINQLVFHTNDLSDKNVFIASFDERNFYSIMPTSYFRRNEGASMMFARINNLPNAPQMQNINGGSLFHALADICKKIDISSLDQLKKLKAKISEMSIEISQNSLIREYNQNSDYSNSNEEESNNEE